MKQPEGAVYILFNADTLGGRGQIQEGASILEAGSFEVSHLPEALEEAENEFQKYMNRKRVKEDLPPGLNRDAG